MNLLSIITMVAITALSLTPNIFPLTQNRTEHNVSVGDRIVDVNHLFILCKDQEGGERCAREKGGGSEPELHPPHQENNPDHFWHYHPSNHEYAYEDGEWNNYHYQFRVSVTHAPNLAPKKLGKIY